MAPKLNFVFQLLVLDKFLDLYLMNTLIELNVSIVQNLTNNFNMFLAISQQYA